MTWPHGLCECNCTVCGGKGLAAFEVERDGRVMRVCTRCDLSDDKNKRLLVTRTDPFDQLEQYDIIGGVCVAGLLDRLS